MAVLVGAPGSGKSTIGRALAESLGVGFLDTDEEIERAAGMDIGSIFVTRGEAGFRELEAEVALAAIATAEGVVSLGGGTVTSAEVRESLAELPVVWLTVDNAEAVKRVGLSGPRPVLLGNVRGRWAELLAEREPHYRAVAQHEVDTTGRPPQDVAAEVLGLLEAS